MAGNQGTDCSNPYCVAGAESPSPPETLTSHRILTDPLASHRILGEPLASHRILGEPLECTVFKTGGRGDEPRRWVRLPCALVPQYEAENRCTLDRACVQSLSLAMALRAALLATRFRLSCALIRRVVAPICEPQDGRLAEEYQASSSRRSRGCQADQFLQCKYCDKIAVNLFFFHKMGLW
ncbi:hypothetical protein HRbin28_02223 [bacterium HR28]|nr:hypothetical protein HRbin28_02223 [bacterium HR28]